MFCFLFVLCIVLSSDFLMRNAPFLRTAFEQLTGKVMLVPADSVSMGILPDVFLCLNECVYLGRSLSLCLMKKLVLAVNNLQLFWSSCPPISARLCH